MKIAVLVASHDRRDTTLACLRSLYDALPLRGDIVLKVFLVDDGSRDGTAGAVASEFPAVRLVRGDGSLYWAGAMLLAWKTAVSVADDWDAFLWLNDDTKLSPDAISRLLSFSTGGNIVVGDLADESGETVYGLRDGGVFTGNCVLVTKGAYERIGMICGGYSHAWADTDYAVRARRAGVAAVGAGVVGVANGHPNRPPLRGKTLRERWRLLSDPKGWNVHDLWLYRRRNWGVCAAAASCMHLIVHVMFGER